MLPTGARTAKAHPRSATLSVAIRQHPSSPLGRPSAEGRAVAVKKNPKQKAQKHAGSFFAVQRARCSMHPCLPASSNASPRPEIPVYCPKKSRCKSDRNSLKATKSLSGVSHCTRRGDRLGIFSRSNAGARESHAVRPSATPPASMLISSKFVEGEVVHQPPIECLPKSRARSERETSRAHHCVFFLLPNLESRWAPESRRGSHHERCGGRDSQS